MENNMIPPSLSDNNSRSLLQRLYLIDNILSTSFGLVKSPTYNVVNAHQTLERLMPLAFYLILKSACTAVFYLMLQFIKDSTENTPISFANIPMDQIFIWEEEVVCHQVQHGDQPGESMQNYEKIHASEEKIKCAIDIYLYSTSSLAPAAIFKKDESLDLKYGDHPVVK